MLTRCGRAVALAVWSQPPRGAKWGVVRRHGAPALHQALTRLREQATKPRFSEGPSTCAVSRLQAAPHWAPEQERGRGGFPAVMADKPPPPSSPTAGATRSGSGPSRREDVKENLSGRGEVPSRRA